MTKDEIQKHYDKLCEIEKRCDVVDEADAVPPMWQLRLMHDVRDLARILQDITINQYGK